MEAAQESQFNPDAKPGPVRFGWRPALSIAAALAAGAALRFWFLVELFEASGDSRLYGNLGKNILLHSRYAISDGSGVLHTTLIRLPGYPLFLAACFRVFGLDNYFSSAVAQILLELAACLMLALTARRIAPAAWPLRAKNGAFHATLWLAAFCPFTASYAASPLTESLTLFSIALALWSVARFQNANQDAKSSRSAWLAALGFTLAVTYAALLRPDGALVGVAFSIPMILALMRGGALAPALTWKSRIAMALACFALAAAPFAVWTARNYADFHVFQPLAPRYATDPGEPTWPGWQSWVKTWCLDFKSTYEIYWNVPDNAFDLTQLPSRAFDSPAQYNETAAIARAYEDNGEDFSYAIDARFAALAAERIAAHPVRYYVLLPLGRVADMLFRPRVENLPIDQDWWDPTHHWDETTLSWFYVGLNLIYLLLGVAGLCLKPRLWSWMLVYFLLRSALLATVEAPEARYTLEFFPMLFVLGGIAIARLISNRKHSTAASDWS
jgi:hypothetical protein